MPEVDPSATHVERELASQPACWDRVAGLLPSYLDALPVRADRVAVAGCGSSLYMARAYAALREAAGHGETDAFPASEFPLARSYDRIVTISRSGTTTEVVDLHRSLGAEQPTTLITADATTPAADLASDVIVLDMATEQSVVQTRFPTTALALFRASLGDQLDGIVDAANDVVDAPLPVVPGADRQFTFLGLGWAAAIAEEAALKCREAAGAWTEAYPAMEYRHGPISVSGPGTVVWVFGRSPAGLADDVAATGATFVDDDLDPMVDLIRAQRLAVALAHHHGRDPDHPQSLSFSVVLDQES